MRTEPKPISRELIIMNIVCILFGGYLYYLHTSAVPATPSPAPQAEALHYDVAVFVEAQNVARQFLTSPASAEFANMSQSSIKTVSDNTYEVTSYVDSQNAFGAMLRSYWTVTIKYTGEKLDRVEAQAVVLNGEKVYGKK